MLGPLETHALCAVLILLDHSARALRIGLLGGALGHPLRFRDAFVINAIGDAACAVTPLRIAGEPARLASLLRFGIPATASFVAIAFEVITMWPVIITCALVLGIWSAPEWIQQTAPVVAAGLARTWGWLALAAVVSALLWILVRPTVHVAPRLIQRPWGRVRIYGRRMPRGTLIASSVLGFVNLASRTAILPVLMTQLPVPPPLGPAILGSFALLYSQLALPTPSGAGVVDLGLLAGAAGSTGESGVELLIWWRFYTTFVGVGLGGWFAVREFGWDAVRGVFNWRIGRSPVTSDQ